MFSKNGMAAIIFCGTNNQHKEGYIMNDKHICGANKTNDGRFFPTIDGAAVCGGIGWVVILSAKTKNEN